MTVGFYDRGVGLWETDRVGSAEGKILHEAMHVMFYQHSLCCCYTRIYDGLSCFRSKKREHKMSKRTVMRE